MSLSWRCVCLLKEFLQQKERGVLFQQKRTEPLNPSSSRLMHHNHVIYLYYTLCSIWRSRWGGRGDPNKNLQDIKELQTSITSDRSLSRRASQTDQEHRETESFKGVVHLSMRGVYGRKKLKVSLSHQASQLLLDVYEGLSCGYEMSGSRFPTICWCNGRRGQHTSFSSYPINLFGPDVSSIGLPSGLASSFVIFLLLFWLHRQPPLHETRTSWEDRGKEQDNLIIHVENDRHLKGNRYTFRETQD